MIRILSNQFSNKALSKCLFIWTICASNIQASHALDNNYPDTIKIASHNLPPYHQKNEQGQLSGPAVKPLNCILSSLKVKPEYSVFPWSRAQLMVKESSYDAFFITSQNKKRDKYAVFSTPFLFDDWYFYTHPARQFKRNEIDMTKKAVGVLLGSNMEHWLRKNGYSNITTKLTYEELFELLSMQRLDVVMSTNQIFQAYIERERKTSATFSAEHIRELKLGIYFGKKFVSSYPNFIAKFNKQVETCVSASISH